MDVYTHLDEGEFSVAVLHYINQMLMEEDMEEKHCMFRDSLELLAAEKSFYEAIGEKYPSSSSSASSSSSSSSTIQHHLHNYHNMESPDDSLSGNLRGYSSSVSNYGTASTSNSTESQSQRTNFHPAEYNPSTLPTTFPANLVSHSSSTSSTHSSLNHTSNSTSVHSGFLLTSMGRRLDSAIHGKSTEYVPQFQRGAEEASKFLPKHNPFILDPENRTFSPSLRKAPQVVATKTEIDEREHFPAYQPEGRKNHEREDEADLQDGRSNKQSAVGMDGSASELSLSELFDKVLLGTGLGKEALAVQQKEESNTNRSAGGRSRVRKQGKKNDEFVELRTLLIQCAQAVASDNRGAAYELLKEIKQHSSSSGNGHQRLAHYFGNGLEARLAGTGTQIYGTLSSKRTSAVEMVKAYQMYASASPFQKLEIIFANNSILSLALAKEVETLHIVDFGIHYGFKWPALIQRLSQRTGGPPKLRITGIDLPQPGFRPAEKVHETGRRLARYCSRFNVPFEFNAIAQKWETIRVEDLKIKENELVAVNCMFWFKKLLDETVVLDNPSPRDAVLNLIRKANPNIFIHAVVNGSYDSPFFVTRFKEALFYYSSLFDMLDTIVAREDPMRLMYEKEIFGREVMNIIACEGCERIERPETYKNWQVRNMKAGFKQLPLDHQLMNKLRSRLREMYHSDFVLEQDGNWVLQGWKGRILYASSCWVPA